MTAHFLRELAALAIQHAEQAETKAIATETVERPQTGEGWRTLLWTCPCETRMTVKDVAEAMAQSPSWVYKHARGEPGHMPHRRHNGGKLIFFAGELRAWAAQTEMVTRLGTVESVAERLLEPVHIKNLNARRRCDVHIGRAKC